MPAPQLFDEIKALATEQRNPRSMNLDRLSVEEILELINAEDHLVPIAIRHELPYIARAVHIVNNGFKTGGRLFYAGAGTSGRLGVVDASECPPTFGTDPEMVKGLIAGGPAAMFTAQEGAEDLEENGASALIDAGVSKHDVVCGIAASRRTPFVVGAVNYARQLGCKTLFVTCTPREQFSLDVDVAICPVVGPEVLMGSTRMKAGTAQKLVLNMITTTAMVRMGKVYENMMIDLQMTNLKLVERARRIVMTVTDLSYDQATEALAQSNGHVKSALVAVLADVSADKAKELLASTDGFVRDAIALGLAGSDQVPD